MDARIKFRLSRTEYTFGTCAWENARFERVLTRCTFQLCVLDSVTWGCFWALLWGWHSLLLGYIFTSAVIKRTAEAMFSWKWRKSSASGNSGSDILGKMALFWNTYRREHRCRYKCKRTTVVASNTPQIWWSIDKLSGAGTDNTDGIMSLRLLN
jgi:hypothetical protein